MSGTEQIGHSHCGGALWSNAEDGPIVADVSNDIGTVTYLDLYAPAEAIFLNNATPEAPKKTHHGSANQPLSALMCKPFVAPMSNDREERPEPEKIDGNKVRRDCESLPSMDLRRRYRAEANSHRNMLQRRKSKGAIVAPEFHNFRDFLSIMGAMPAKGATLDRIDHEDPEYAPGKVRWADRRTQNTNKSDTITVINSVTRDVFTVSRLAKLQQVSPATIRKRIDRGWSDDEVIAGHRRSAIDLPFSQKAPSGAKEVLCHRCGAHVEHAPRGRRDYSHDADEAPRKPLTGLQRMIDINRREFERDRQLNPDGEEQLPAPHYDFNEPDTPPGVDVVPYDRWLKHFANLWCMFKPVLYWPRTSEYHKKAIWEIDPEYAAQQEEKFRKRLKIAESL